MKADLNFILGNQGLSNFFIPTAIYLLQLVYFTWESISEPTPLYYLLDFKKQPLYFLNSNFPINMNSGLLSVSHTAALQSLLDILRSRVLIHNLITWRMEPNNTKPGQLLKDNGRQQLARQSTTLPDNNGCWQAHSGNYPFFIWYTEWHLFWSLCVESKTVPCPLSSASCPPVWPSVRCSGTKWRGCLLWWPWRWWPHPWSLFHSYLWDWQGETLPQTETKE